MWRCYIACTMFALVSIGLAAAPVPETDTPIDASTDDVESLDTEPAPPNWAVPVRFKPQRPLRDTRRDLPLPRNTKLNPTLRNGGIVVGIGAAVLGTLGAAAALGQLSNNPLPGEPAGPNLVVF